MTGGFGIKPTVNKTIMVASYPEFSTNFENSTVALWGIKAKFKDIPTQPYLSASIGPNLVTKYYAEPDAESDDKTNNIRIMGEAKAGCTIPLGDSDFSLNPQYRFRGTLDDTNNELSFSSQHRLTSSLKYKISDNVYAYATPSLVANAKPNSETEYRVDAFGGIGVNIGKSCNLEAEAHGYNLCNKDKFHPGANVIFSWTF